MIVAIITWYILKNPKECLVKKIEETQVSKGESKAFKATALLKYWQNVM